jgi:membrane protease YdiL (CAAX protease family)
MIALVASTPIFGLLHLLGNSGLADVLTSLVGGFLFGTAYVLSGQLSLPIGVHFGGVAIITLLQEPVSQSPELTLPSIFVVDGIVDISLAQSVELWIVRATVGIVLICVWVYYSTGEIAIAEEVYP